MENVAIHNCIKGAEMTYNKLKKNKEITIHHAGFVLVSLFHHARNSYLRKVLNDKRGDNDY